MAGRKCMVLFCKNRGPIPGIKYFRLTAARRNAWLRVLGRDPNIEPLTDGNRVCSVHFADDHLFVRKNRLCLKSDAIPTKQLGLKRLCRSVQVEQPTVPILSYQKTFPNETETLVNAEHSEATEPIFEYVNVEDWKIEDEPPNVKEEHLDLDESSRFEIILSNEMELLVKREEENNEAVNDLGQMCDINFQDVEIKNEKLDIKEEDLQSNESSYVCSKKQQKATTVHKRQQKMARKHRKHQNQKVNEGDVEKIIQEIKLQTHLLQQNPKPVYMFTCGQCDFQTNRKKFLKLHSLMHQNPEEVDMINCDQCEFQTCSKSYIQIHRLRHKNPEELNMFKCDQCDFQTFNKWYLKVHRRRHQNLTDVDKFKCDQCNFKTIYKSYLNIHLLRHKNPEEVNMYRCDQCDFQTLNKSYIKIHLLQHKNPDDVAMFKCDQCGYRTVRKSSLKEHVLRHKSPGEVALFKCDQCNFQTIYKNSLNRHVLRQHNLEDVDML